MDKKDIFFDDFNLISKKHDFSLLKNSTIFITGSTGLIGSQIVLFLDYLNQMQKFNIKILALIRSEKKAKSIFGDVIQRIKLIYGDIMDLPEISEPIDYVIHGASITDSKTFIEKPVETISTALDGSRNVIKQFIGKDIKSFVYLSSLEVYGSFPNNEGIKRVCEADSGYINTLSIRSSYSESKRMVENICISYVSEFNIPIKIVRLCQTFGPGVKYSDNRVFAQFARSVIEGKDIVLKTKGETVRNYCYTADAISGILIVLIKGFAGEAYNIANPYSTISIADLAHLYCSLFSKSNAKVIFDIVEDAEKLGYNPILKLELDSSKLVNLGWIPITSLEDSIKKLVHYMLENK